MTSWNNVENAILEIQVGGPSYPWEVVDFIAKNSAELAEPTGGGRGGVTDRFGRNFRKGGRLERVGVFRSEDPARWETSIKVREYIAKAFDYFKNPIPFNVRARHFLGDPLDKTNYNKIIQLCEAYLTDGGPYSNPLVKGSTGVSDDTMRTYALSASDLMELWAADHANISEAAPLDDAINHIISVGWPRTPIEDPTLTRWNDGNRDYIAAQDKDVASTTPAVVIFRDDGAGGLTKSRRAITVLNTYDVLAVAKAGPLILAAGTGGIAYANYEDAVAAAETWVVASGITLGTPINFIVAVTDKICYAVGNTGKIYRSVDGGMSWTLWNDGLLSANNLTRMAVANENLVWIGGASGTLLKIENGVGSVVASGTSAAINAIAIPQRRDNEVYVGTSDGKIRRSRNLGASWVDLPLDVVASSSIDSLAFEGPQGSILYAVQTNGSAQSRIIRDLTGGNCGQDVEFIGSFTAPVGGKMNWIAVSDENHAVTVGEAISAKAWIGLISPKVAA